MLQDRKDKFYAVQCKFKLDENTKLCWTKDKIGNFFGSTNKVDGYIVFANTYDIDKVSQTRSQHFQFINIADLLEIRPETFLTIYNFLNNNKVKNQLFTPKTHQATAIQNAINYYTNNSKGKLILPCGAGKTLTSLWIKEALNVNSTLVILPSLSLLRQFKNEWKSQSKQQFDYLCVCSDTEIDNDDDIIRTKTYQVDIKVSSNPEEIRQFLEKEESKIIFSTYQSLDKVRDSIANSNISFDFSICDEAHRTAGVKNIDIVQATGRALRKADGKKLGYIIIPIYHSQKTKKEDVIAGFAFKRLIDVIKAMADHDERLQDEIDAIASGKKTLKNDSKIDYIEKGVSNDQASKIKESPIKLLNFNEDLKQYYFAEIIEKTSDGWNFNLQKLVDWIEEHNGSYPTKEENQNIYQWTVLQRTNKNSNKLSSERINKLNEINFIWDWQENSWNEKYQKLIDWKNSNLDPLK